MKTPGRFLLLYLVIIPLLPACETPYKHPTDEQIREIIERAERARERDSENCLRLIRGTPIDLVLTGVTAAELSLPCPGISISRDRIEPIFNEILIEWKTKGLPELLHNSSSGQLKDLAINLEKAILKLDLKSKELKDAADEDARQVTPPGGTPAAKKAPASALTIAYLLDQRKTILMVILGAVKQAAAQRASGG